MPTTASVFCALGGLVAELSHDALETVHGIEADGAFLAGRFAMLRGHADEWLSRQAPPEHLIDRRFQPIDGGAGPCAISISMSAHMCLTA